MTAVDHIRRCIQTHPGISQYTTIIENVDIIDLSTIQKGLLIVYASWSAVARENFKDTIRRLDEFNYEGTIIIVDNDLLKPDFQLQILGEVCHG